MEKISLFYVMNESDIKDLAASFFISDRLYKITNYFYLKPS